MTVIATQLSEDLCRMEDAITALGGCLDAGQWSTLRKYAELLHFWTAKVNLVAPDDRNSLGSRHLVPAIAMASVVAMVPHQTIMDFGSGGGIPGIPLKVLLADSSMTLIESRRRKSNFLREAVRSLALEKVAVVNKRLEDWPPPPGGVDVVVSRATAHPAEFARLVAPYLAPHGVLVTTVGKRHRDSHANLRLLMDSTMSWPGGTVTIGVLEARQMH